MVATSSYEQAYWVVVILCQDDFFGKLGREHVLCLMPPISKLTIGCQ